MKTRTIQIDEINRAANSAPSALAAKAEARYHTQLDALSEEVARQAAEHRIILIAGPSASGKTTTSEKLRKGICRRGIQSVAISLDDFFKNRDDLARLPDGSADFDSVDAIDLAAVKRCFSELLKSNAAQLPQFDFIPGKRIGYKRIAISPAHIVIVEGIHALNPALTKDFNADRFYKIYISAEAEFADGDTPVLRGQDLRLIRRLIRDHLYRGSGPENTLEMWKNVIREEEASIVPFRETADFVIDSVHDYEPAVYKREFEALTRMVTEESDFAFQMRRIAQLLSVFVPLPKEIIPEGSMLREFIG